ncbi:MAG: A/G-specific adenine glycosylase [Bacteroidota bacterium]
MSEGYVGRVEQRHLDAFHGPLAAWFEQVRRPMPWRETGPDGRRDPYRVWLSEIMLQQTRVDQARPYYERFTATFPTVDALAAANLDDVLKAWEGLGYYSRARNLHRAAQQVVDAFDGRMPETEAEIRSLPGVGPYTAAAVLSLAHGVPLAVLDGNVIRVLTRVFAIGDDVTSGRTRRHLQALADALLDRDHPGRFNESVMELGATVCTPAGCRASPLRAVCTACAEGNPTRYPIAKKKKPVPHRDVAVGVLFDDEGRVLVQQRPTDAMLGGLWEFPGGKVEPGETVAEACRRELQEELSIEVEVGEPLDRIDHAYSHFKITLHAFACRLVAGTPVHHAAQPMRWVAVEDLDDLAFPRASRRLIDTLVRREQNPTLF